MIRRRAYIKRSRIVRKPKKPCGDPRRTRAAVIKRDSYGCLLCERCLVKIDLHCIHYKSEGGIYEPDNCVQLCHRLCHLTIVHGNKRLWKPILLEYINRRNASDLTTALAWLRMTTAPLLGDCAK